MNDLELIEAYLDAVPRSSSDPEAVGKFTLFRSRGPWPYYARPRLGLVEPISAQDVEALLARQRGLNVPRNIEWVLEATPSLAQAAESAGLHVSRYPLMILERPSFRPLPAPEGLTIRFVPHDDPDFARVHSVATVGFAVSGTAVGPEGPAQRDTSASAMAGGMLDFMRRRARDGVSVSAAAFDETGPLAVGTHQPVGAVTEVVGVATLPSARRRGLGAAVTAALVEDAWARGVTTVFLSAGSDDVARVYQRIGFRRIGTAGAAEPSAPDHEGVDVNA